ncbi:MAG: deoxyguanosinetriphosphate triphosphohydrolase [Alphaproteobacteria bacterium]
MRAPYASDPAKSRGRLHPEAESATRSCFQRDRDRIIHSTAFRRLKHKTQVFIAPEGDHYRTRLTHSLEVSQIARGLARSLGLDEDLAEALALAHDFGHPPFGHAGETALNEMMRPFGGFDHNDQTLRVLTMLEHRYAEFDGLNLTWETLEGVVKHNGPIKAPLTRTLKEYCVHHDLELNSYAGPEAQVAAIADDIAYDHHDIDDGLRAGLLRVEDFEAVPYVGAVFESVKARYPKLEQTRLIHESVRRLIDLTVNDVLAESRRRLHASGARSAADVRALDHPVIAFSEEMREKDRALKRFLFARVYRHPSVTRETDRAQQVLKQLFARLLDEPAILPPPWRKTLSGEGQAATARVIADYIAGMTDPYALRRHAELCGNAAG